jgi:hypothetical protein
MSGHLDAFSPPLSPNNAPATGLLPRFSLLSQVRCGGHSGCPYLLMSHMG